MQPLQTRRTNPSRVGRCLPSCTTARRGRFGYLRGLQPTLASTTQLFCANEPLFPHFCSIASKYGNSKKTKHPIPRKHGVSIRAGLPLFILFCNTRAAWESGNPRKRDERRQRRGGTKRRFAGGVRACGEVETCWLAHGLGHESCVWVRQEHVGVSSALEIARISQTRVVQVERVSFECGQQHLKMVKTTLGYGWLLNNTVLFEFSNAFEAARAFYLNIRHKESPYKS